MSDNATGIKAMLALLARLEKGGRITRPPFPVNTKLKEKLEKQKEEDV